MSGGWRVMNGGLSVALTMTWLMATAAAGVAQGAPAGSGPPGTAAAAGQEERAPGPGWQSYGEADYGWRIQALDGDTLTLERFEGEVLFINVWASWCTPCIRELGSIERLRERLLDTDVRFLIVATESEGPVRRFLRRYRYDLPVYLERTRVPSSFGMRGLPTTWVVDRDGTIVLLRHGEAVWDTDEIETFVRAVAQRPVRP